MLNRNHSCYIQTHHLPMPHVIVQHHLVPISWQMRLYGQVRVSERVGLCPTHHYHAHLAIDAAVNQICFSQLSIFDRRQFGRELWGWAEDSALWLRERLLDDPDINWQVALPSEDVQDPDLSVGREPMSVLPDHD